MSADDIPTEVRVRLVGLMGEAAAAEWWTTPETAWLGGLVPAQLYGSGRDTDQQMVIEVVEAALVGAIPIEGH